MKQKKHSLQRFTLFYEDIRPRVRALTPKSNTKYIQCSIFLKSIIEWVGEIGKKVLALERKRSLSLLHLCWAYIKKVAFKCRRWLSGNWLRSNWRQTLISLYILWDNFQTWRKKPRYHLEVKFKITLTKVIALYVLATILWPHQAVAELPPPTNRENLPQIAPIHAEDIKELEYAAKTEPPVVPPVVKPPAPSVIESCGDNFYARYIYQHESGCNLNALNSIGCRGIGQRCPGSVLLNACPNLDYACQNEYFTSYVNARYGGWQGAYNFWLKNHWY